MAGRSYSGLTHNVLIALTEVDEHVFYEQRATRREFKQAKAELSGARIGNYELNYFFSKPDNRLQGRVQVRRIG